MKRFSHLQLWGKDSLCKLGDGKNGLNKTCAFSFLSVSKPVVERSRETALLAGDSELTVSPA